MKELKIFENPQFGEIRTSGTSDEPMFCLSDVCKALDLQSKHVKERLSDGVVSTDIIVDSLGREQQALFVNEDGLYDVIFDSRKPEAIMVREGYLEEMSYTNEADKQYVMTCRRLTEAGKKFGRNKLFPNCGRYLPLYYDKAFTRLINELREKGYEL